jgi:DNA-binding FadR family transcriptional regulator
MPTASSSTSCSRPACCSRSRSRASPQRAREQDVLRALVDEVIAAASDHARTIEVDVRVHHLIAQIADNRLAGALTGWIVDVLQPRLAAVIEPAVVVSVIADQHRDLLEAIARGDPVAAERAMREHLVYLRDVVTAVEQSGPAKAPTEATAPAVHPRHGPG